MKVIVKYEVSVTKGFDKDILSTKTVIEYDGKQYCTRWSSQENYEGGKIPETEIIEYESEEAFRNAYYDDYINDILKYTPLYNDPKKIKKLEVRIVEKPRGWTITLDGYEITQKRCKSLCEFYGATKDSIADELNKRFYGVETDYYGHVTRFLSRD